MTISSLSVNNLMIVLLPAPVIPKKATIAAILANSDGIATDAKEGAKTTSFVASQRKCWLTSMRQAQILTVYRIIDDVEADRSRRGLAYSAKSQEGMVVSFHDAPFVWPSRGAVASLNNGVKTTIMSANLVGNLQLFKILLAVVKKSISTFIHHHAKRSSLQTMVRIKKSRHHPPVEAGSSSQAQSHGGESGLSNLKSTKLALDESAASGTVRKGEKRNSVLISDGKTTTTIEYVFHLWAKKSGGI